MAKFRKNGYCCIGLAVGLAIGGSSPLMSVAVPIDSAQNVFGRTAAIQTQNLKLRKHESPCNPLNHSRKIELCAQWKAADAAADSAKWAFWTLIAMLIQTLVATFAFIAIVFDLRQNRFSAERQLRAYVEFDGIDASWQVDENINSILRLKNSGQTPAYNLYVSARIWAENADGQITATQGDFEQSLPATVGSMRSVGFKMTSDQLITEKMMRFIDSGEYQLHVVCFAHYSDVFGKRRDLAITLKSETILNERAFRPTAYGSNYST